MASTLFFLQEIITLIENAGCLTMEYLLQHLQTRNGQLHLSCSSANQVPATARSLTEVEGTGCHHAFEIFFPSLLITLVSVPPSLFKTPKYITGSNSKYREEKLLDNQLI